MRNDVSALGTGLIQLAARTPANPPCVLEPSTRWPAATGSFWG